MPHAFHLLRSVDQARAPIPCFGTTHADQAEGAIPCTKMIPPEAVAEDYELGIGKLIVETFATRDFIHTPVVIVAGHGPFAWDKSALAAVQNAASLEEVARMAYLTLGID